MKNNSVMKCCVCNNKKSGEFITIDNKKYHLCCIKQLKDNWNKLKEYIQEDYDFFGKLIDPKYGCAMGALSRVKDKMQKIEESDNNVKD